MILEGSLQYGVIATERITACRASARAVALGVNQCCSSKQQDQIKHELYTSRMYIHTHLVLYRVHLSIVKIYALNYRVPEKQRTMGRPFLVPSPLPFLDRSSRTLLPVYFN